MDTELRKWAMICHLSAYVMFLSIPSIIGPLVIWLWKRDEIPGLDEHGRNALNFHLTMWILMILCLILFFLVIPLFLLPVIALIDMIFPAIATIKADKGEVYEYPLSWKFL